MTTDLSKQRCIPCEGNVPALTESEAAGLLQKLGSDWKLDSGKLTRRFRFNDFVQALSFVNRVGEIAQAENHHPDILIEYNRVCLSLYTHSIKGLSQNDFILAAKISELATL